MNQSGSKGGIKEAIWVRTLKPTGDDIISQESGTICGGHTCALCIVQECLIVYTNFGTSTQISLHERCTVIVVKEKLGFDLSKLSSSPYSTV